MSTYNFYAGELKLGQQGPLYHLPSNITNALTCKHLIMELLITEYKIKICQFIYKHNFKNELKHVLNTNIYKI